ncbi:MAG: hypothetical protein BWY75_03060 [bacterium ADurb.Bin425]|nr:MAG: hypothetical protein BWY75_03060 [bacterium ADurb.Bin425]
MQDRKKQIRILHQLCWIAADDGTATRTDIGKVETAVFTPDILIDAARHMTGQMVKARFALTQGQLGIGSRSDVFVEDIIAAKLAAI